MLPKQLFYVTIDQLCAYQWQRGGLSPGQSFSADRAGMDAFARHLDDTPNVRAYIVADLVEEDFQRHLLPHVGGRAGRNLIERRLTQLYRDTPYRHAAIQGRDTEGRRDDHALFSALTNAALLQPWVAVIEQRKVPLAAIYSAAMLSTLLVRKLAMAQEHLLLITEQAGGLRQSYFEGQYLKFSRLTALAPGEDLVATTETETAKMKQFLNSTRLLGRGEMLHVLVLAPRQRLPELEQRCEDSTEVSFHFIDLDTAAARLPIQHTPALADPLLLHLLGRQNPVSQYHLGSPGRFYRIWQARMAFNAATAAVVTIASVWLLANVWAMFDARSQHWDQLTEAAQFDARYRAVMGTLPPVAAKSANMKAAVQLEQVLSAQAPAPAQLVALLSQSLERAPAVRLMGLDWQVEQAAPAAANTNSGEGPAPISSALLGLHGKPVQLLRIDGEVEAAPSDYRGILDSMNAFALDLARHPGVSVAIAEAPIDVRQNVKLTGNTDLVNAEAKPKFALKVTWKP